MGTQTYTINGLDCASCARTVSDGVRRLDGAESVELDFATCTLRVSGAVAPAAVRQRVAALGYGIAEPDAPAAPREDSGGVAGFGRYLWRRGETRLALLLRALGLPAWLANAVFVGALALTAWPIARSGVRALLINRTFSINLLMTIAAVGALAIGDFFEAATVIFLFAIGEALEGYTADRARQSLRGLLDLAPPTAVRLEDGRETSVPVAQIAIDDLVLVRPGERIPLDGLVVSGSSGVNQAPITGESMPVFKSAGDSVWAGTIAGDGSLRVRVTHLAADSTLSRIIHLLEEAQGNRAASQRLIDRFAHWYTPAVVVLALLIAVLPPLFGAGWAEWTYRALTLLVIACPCALVISAPVTVMSGITAAARRGVLIKGGVHLEALGSIKAVAFDKTGTLTTGEPVVTATRSLDCVTGGECGLCDDVLALAASVERSSTHPLARAITAAAASRRLDGVYAPAEQVRVLAGQGVQGQVQGKLVTIGSHALFEAEHPHAAAVCDLVDAAEARGHTAMLVCDGSRVSGLLAVADAVRPESAAIVGQLNALGLSPVMLTGDNPVVANAVGAAAGISDVRANLLPADKVDAVRALQTQYRGVAMVGDGINDTPALATATVGIAMGGAGSAQAMETADVVLMANSLGQLPFAIRVARLVRRLIAQNIGFSLATKLVFMALALAGGTSLWLAILADVGVSLLVTLNGMRPLLLK
ncbi:MAG TPA: heavy metal translocating P-type ATPase [Herpetosiphonaceae bacterium]|nr:heavy metal translocating P-type ATPase [Herpetosiphonaceae bacterium]